MVRFHKRKPLFNDKRITPYPSNIKNEPLYSELAANEQMVKDIFQNCADLVIHPIYVKGKPQMLLIFLDGLTDSKTLEHILLKPMLFDGYPNGLGEVHSFQQIIEQQLFAVTPIKTVTNYGELVEGILMGNVGIIIEGDTKGLIADFKGMAQRSVEEPATEITIRGPRDGFTESIRINTSLLRRRIRSSWLKLESLTIGELSKTSVEIAYIEGIAPENLLPQKALKSAVWGIISSAFTVSIVALCVLLTFGPEISSKLRHPTFDLVSYISVMDFIQNLEIIAVLVWILSVFIKLSLYFFLACYGTAQLFRIKNWRKMIWITAPFFFALAQFYPNPSYAFGYMKTYWVYYALPINMVGIPLLLWGIGSLRKKHSGNHAKH